MALLVCLLVGLGAGVFGYLSWSGTNRRLTQELEQYREFTQVLEQKQSDTEARVNSIESTVSEISGSLKKLQETSEQALLNKDSQLKESEEKLKKSERTSSFFKGFSVVTGIGSVVSTLLLVIVVVL